MRKDTDGRGANLANKQTLKLTMEFIDHNDAGNSQVTSFEVTDSREVIGLVQAVASNPGFITMAKGFHELSKLKALDGKWGDEMAAFLNSL